MKIVIDARTGFGTGVGRYAANLIDQLQSIDTNNDYVVMVQPRDAAKWRLRSANFRALEVDCPIYSFAEQIKLAWILYGLQPDVVHFSSFNAPLLYFGKRVTTIHDLILVNFRNVRPGLKGLLNPLKYWLMRLVLHQAVSRSVAVMAPTEFVKKDILATWRKLRDGAGRIHVTLEAADSLKEVDLEDPGGIGKSFLFYVGNTYPHKNLAKLIEAFGLLGDRDLELVIAGQEDYFYEQLKRSTDDKRIIFPGYLSEGQLVWLYQNAQAFVFPSLTEGFGLPPLEAMSYGTPVISSNASCMPEVLGEAAVYFDPRSPSDMARAIRETLADPAVLARLRAAGPEHVKQFSWRRMAEQTLAVYESVGKTRG